MAARKSEKDESAAPAPYYESAAVTPRNEEPKAREAALAATREREKAAEALKAAQEKEAAAWNAAQVETPQASLAQCVKLARKTVAAGKVPDDLANAIRQQLGMPPPGNAA